MAPEPARTTPAAFLLALAATTWIALQAAAQVEDIGRLDSGRDIVAAACAAFAARTARERSAAELGFQPPDTYPDFSRCDQTAQEANRDYRAIVRSGGPARAFSPIMPAFGAALSPAQIDAVVDYLRTLCTDRGWPRGELNVPRALSTEKAFPEEELVLTTAAGLRGPTAIDSELVYEKRLGRHDQLEFALPFAVQSTDSHATIAGIGDAAVGWKHVLFAHSSADERSGHEQGSILSLQGEVILPTGSRSRGLGSGETSYGVFAMYDLLLPGRAFLQVQAGGEFPFRRGSGEPNALYARFALGRSFNQGLGAGRLWSPMIEFIGNRDLADAAPSQWDVLPQLQVTLSRRQHMRLNVGVDIPVNDRDGRAEQFLLYVLWDMADGGLLEGW
ncbi:MAG: hypothetical protein U1F35_19475 [Steroidobacteraceae bacterium]